MVNPTQLAAASIALFAHLGCISADSPVSAPCVNITGPTDNVTENTLRIQSALDAAPLVPGGGCVSVSGGDFKVAGVSVRSNTTFRIEEGTRLVAVINVTRNAVVQASVVGDWIAS